jgi:hypothetical protein
MECQAFEGKRKEKREGRDSTSLKLRRVKEEIKKKKEE